MEHAIKQILLNLGADVCAIANVDRFAGAPEGFRPTDIYADCKSVVVFAKGLPRGLSKVSPRIIYNTFNTGILADIDRITMAACGEIERLGGVAVPVPCDSPYEYWDGERLEGRGILSMRHAALLAGLGSMGKNTLIINRTLGNMMNIGALMTNLELASDPPAEELCIKGCRICIDACPVHALDGITVNQALCRPNAYATNDRGFGVCNCNRCRISCPMAYGVR